MCLCFLKFKDYDSNKVFFASLISAKIFKSENYYNFIEVYSIEFGKAVIQIIKNDFKEFALNFKPAGEINVYMATWHSRDDMKNVLFGLKPNILEKFLS